MGTEDTATRLDVIATAVESLAEVVADLIWDIEEGNIEDIVVRKEIRRGLWADLPFKPVIFSSDTDLNQRAESRMTGLMREIQEKLKKCTYLLYNEGSDRWFCSMGKPACYNLLKNELCSQHKAEKGDTSGRNHGIRKVSCRNARVGKDGRIRCVIERWGEFCREDPGSSDPGIK